MPNKILKILIKKDKSLIDKLELELYENQLLRYPLELRAWSKFIKLRNLFYE